MVSVIHDVFLAIAAPEPKARAAAESILVTEQLATQHNIASFGLDIVDIAPIRQTKRDKLRGTNWKPGMLRVRPKFGGLQSRSPASRCWQTSSWIR